MNERDDHGQKGEMGDNPYANLGRLAEKSAVVQGLKINRNADGVITGIDGPSEAEAPGPRYVEPASWSQPRPLGESQVDHMRRRRPTIIFPDGKPATAEAPMMKGLTVERRRDASVVVATDRAEPTITKQGFNVGTKVKFPRKSGEIWDGEVGHVVAGEVTIYFIEKGKTMKRGANLDDLAKLNPNIAPTEEERKYMKPDFRIGMPVAVERSLTPEQKLRGEIHGTVELDWIVSEPNSVDINHKTNLFVPLEKGMVRVNQNMLKERRWKDIELTHLVGMQPRYEEGAIVRGKAEEIDPSWQVTSTRPNGEVLIKRADPDNAGKSLELRYSAAELAAIQRTEVSEPNKRSWRNPFNR